MHTSLKKTITYYITLSILLTPLLFTTACAQAQKISQEEFAKKIEGDNKPLILDVRSLNEFLMGHVPGAINIPHNQITKRLNEIIAYKEKEIVVYCRSGFRAGFAEKDLETAGFTRLFHLAGDMNAWKKNNKPIKKGPATEAEKPQPVDSSLTPPDSSTH
jgi:phage shock protein E